jgi:hypothetical protein
MAPGENCLEAREVLLIGQGSCAIGAYSFGLRSFGAVRQSMFLASGRQMSKKYQNPVTGRQHQKQGARETEELAANTNFEGRTVFLSIPRQNCWRPRWRWIS